jgi:hypothetical protein
MFRGVLLPHSYSELWRLSDEIAAGLCSGYDVIYFVSCRTVLCIRWMQFIVHVILLRFF